ncbi:MAG TPA: serine/threonine-protein kinase [Polyangiaceae bacterium]|jgi:serine/threonine-protein kinase
MQPVSPEERAASYVGRLVSQRYRLLSLIGAGGMASVFRAQDLGGNTFALKIMYTELLEGEFAQRFERESMLALGLSHPHVVPTVDAGRDYELGLHFLVMPFLAGQDVDNVLEKHGALECECAVRIALQAARGLAAAHALGIVHRDIKPGNLLLDPQGAALVVRVCDFGIAKQMSATGGDSLTATGRQLGTPDYASPEQLRNAKASDQRTDVWGLGATLYHLLCGVPPFGQLESVFDVIAAIISEPPPPIQERAPWVEPGLAEVVHRAMNRDPKLRFATMNDFANALRPFSGGHEQLDDTQIRSISKRSRERVAARVQDTSRAASAPAASAPAFKVPAARAAAPDPASANAKPSKEARARAASPAAAKSEKKPRAKTEPTHEPKGSAVLGLALIVLGVLGATAGYWLTRH